MPEGIGTPGYDHSREEVKLNPDEAIVENEAAQHALAKLPDLREMIEHWHDEYDVVNPAEGFAGLDHENAGKYLDYIMYEKNGLERRYDATDDHEEMRWLVSNRPAIFFHSTSARKLQSITEHGYDGGDFSVVPMYSHHYGYISSRKTSERLYLVPSKRTEVENPEIVVERGIDDIELSSIETLAELLDMESTLDRDPRDVSATGREVTLIFGGESGEKIKQGARIEKSWISKNGMLNESDISNFQKEPLTELSFHGRKIRHLEISPSGMILPLADYENGLSEMISKREHRIEVAQETEKMMSEQGKEEIEQIIVTVTGEERSSIVKKSELAPFIERCQAEIKDLRDNYTQRQELVMQIANKYGALAELPVFDLHGNMLWPEHLSHEEVEKLLLEEVSI